MPRIAFFGGSFDPPHLGHLAAARAAQAALNLDLVLFAPVGAQPFKPQGASAGFADRVAMTRLAIADEPGFAVSLLDAPDPTGKPNYTIDTLHALRAENPAADLFLLLGADTFAQLRNWHRAAEVPFAASIIVVSRPGQPLDRIHEFLPAGITLTQNPAPPAPFRLLDTYSLTSEAGRTALLYVLRGIEVPISATQVRSQTHAGAPAPLPPAVAGYIRRHNLYR